MSCCGRREKLVEARAEQKWDYINLSDFKSTSCLTPLSYGIIYISLAISVACYVVDLFTAANLLFFNRWSGQVQPVIPFNVSRWIFAACILLSWILLVYRWVRAVRAMRTGIVAASYLDPLAVMIQSVRVGENGRGWKRFLVFAELTKGRKGAEYVALFTYFSFEAWLRIIFAEGPRQVINALTLYSVMEANLVPVGEHAASKGHSPIAQFFVNIKILADHNKQQAAVLFGMLFTLLIWIIAALSLAMAGLFYILFLWHHVPTADNGLSGYCRRKVDRRLQKIVGVKVNKALAKGNDSGRKNESKALKARGIPAQVVRQPTLPKLDTDGDDKSFETLLSRQSTASPLPLYTPRQPSRNDSHPNSANGGEPTIPDMFPIPSRPMPPSRLATQSSVRSDTSYASDAPLIGQAAEMSYEDPPRPYSPAGLSRINSDHGIISNRSIQDRGRTASPMGTQRPFNDAWKPLPITGRKTPGPLHIRPPNRQNDGREGFGATNSEWYSSTQHHAISPGLNDLPAMHSPRRTPGPYETRQTPIQEYEMRSQNPAHERSQGLDSSGFVAFNPTLHSPETEQRSRVIPPSLNPPRVRNFTMPTKSLHPINLQTQHAQRAIPPVRSGTAPISQGYSYYGPPPPRSGTAPIAQSNAYRAASSNADFVFRNGAPSREVKPFNAVTTSSGAARMDGPRRPMPERFH